jgi:hypothetical protein
VLHGGVTPFFNGLTDTWEYGASYRLLGAGCIGSNGVPSLASTAVPRVGAPFVVRLGNLASNAVVAAFAAGFSNTTWTFGTLPADLSSFGLTGCTLYVSPEALVFMPVLAGAASLTLNIPASQALVGLELHQQGVSLDAGVNPAGMVLSNAMTALIGN